jgi:hypothetical protein
VRLFFRRFQSVFHRFRHITSIAQNIEGNKPCSHPLRVLAGPFLYPHASMQGVYEGIANTNMLTMPVSMEVLASLLDACSRSLPSVCDDENIHSYLY